MNPRPLLITALLLAGCQTPVGADVAPAVDVPITIPGCEEDALSACDVREPACQQQVLVIVSCLRQQPDAQMPSVQVITEADYAAIIAARPEEADVEPNPGFASLVMLGMADPDPALSARKPAAFYSFDEKHITIIDRKKPFDDADATVIFAHELVHALQDQEHDLAKYFATNSENRDSSLGARAIVEGEATLYETLLRASLYGLDVRTLNLELAFTSRAETWHSYALEQSSPYAAARTAMLYGIGAHYVYLSWRDYNPAGPRALYADPPTSSLRLIASVDAIAAELPREPFTAPNTMRPIVYQTVLGAVAIRAFGGVKNRAEADAAALAWRGDHLWVYSDVQPGFVWTLRFQTDDAASRFSAMANKVANGISTSGVSLLYVRRAANVVTIFGSHDHDLRLELVDAFP